MMVSFCTVIPHWGFDRWWASIVVSLDGSTKILKPSDILVLRVMVGSKTILPFLCSWLLWFFSFLRYVRVRLSGGGSASRLYLDCRSYSISAAVLLHLCGFVHPCLLSLWQGVHAQDCCGTCCLGCVSGCSVHSASLIMSIIMLTVWLFRIHLLFRFRYCLGVSPRWCQAGIFSLRSCEIFTAAKWTLNFFAVVSISRM